MRKFTLTSILILFLFFFVDALCITEKNYQSRRNSAAMNNLHLFRSLQLPDNTLSERFALRYFFYDCAGIFHRLIGRNYVNEIYRNNDGYLLKRQQNIDVSESAERLVQLKTFCSQHGTKLLYVNFPYKTASDSDLSLFGTTCYANQNADAFLEELRKNDIDYIDMREYFHDRYANLYEAFFKTDHHWKISSGLYCAQVLSSEINERYHLGLSPEKIADKNMSISLMENSWVGEYGQKTGASYSGMDDFELIEPVIPTSFHLKIPNRKMDTDGDFSVMLNKKVLDINGFWERRYGRSLYYLYLYGNDPIQTIHNNDESSGRILLIKDSFAQAVSPFLAMTANTIVNWDLRYNDMSLYDFIEKNDFDIVIVMYSSSMIGREINGRLMFDFSH